MGSGGIVGVVRTAGCLHVLATESRVRMADFRQGRPVRLGSEVKIA